MLRKGAVLLALVIVTGCGSSIAGNKPGPVAVEHHLVYEKVVGEEGIWIADADGGHARLLVLDGHTPVISPDGKLVAYLGFCTELDPDCDRVYVVSTSGSEKPRLLAKGFGETKTPWFGAPMRWSPDSKRIITSRSPGDELVSIDVASAKVTELAKGEFSGWSLSPDGKRIVFARAENPKTEPDLATGDDLFVADLDGGEAKRITDTGDANDPVWGLKSIAFSKVIACNTQGPADRCRNHAWGRNEIWRVQPDGTGAKNVTGSYATRFQYQGCVGLLPIDWSEDGRALLGARLCEFSTFPLRVDPETGATRELDWRAETVAAHAVALSRDGDSVLLQDGAFGPDIPDDPNTVLIAPYLGGMPKVVARGAIAPSWNR